MKYKIHENPILGKKPFAQRPVRVIGAGISGLLAGFYLKKNRYDFEIVEQAEAPGGLLGTLKLSSGIAEQAANGFIWCPELQEIADDLGLNLIGPQETAKKRFLVRNGHLSRFPLNFLETISIAGRALLPHPKPLETVADFGNAYFGAGFTRQILAPGLAGVYGAQAQHLSFSGALPKVAKILNHSSLLPLALIKNRLVNPPVKSPNQRLGTHSFAGGMGSLVEALANHLQGHLRFGVDGLTYQNEQDHLLITTPAHQAQQFFTGRLQTLLQQVEYSPLITATFFFKRSDLAKFEDGFGCLIPRTEGLKTLGVLFNSSIFPHRTRSEEIISLTAIVEETTPDLATFQLEDEQVMKIICKDLDLLFDLQADPLEYKIFRWEKAIPLYSPQLYQSWFEMNTILEKEFPNRNLFGNYTGQISIRGMAQATGKWLSEKK